MKTAAYITMNELVFAHRNRSYGAYYLRTRYNRIASVATSVAFILFLMAWALPQVAENLMSRNSSNDVVFKTSGIYEMTNIDPADQVKIDQLEPSPEMVRQIAFITPEVTRNVTNDIPTRGDFDSLQTGSFTVRVGLDPGSIIDNGTQHLVDIVAPDSVFTIVEQPAEYPGGIKNLYKDLSNSLLYPELSKENKVEGKVYMKFVVGKNGKIRDIQIARSNVDEQCNQAAIDAVSKLKAWQPARHNGNECATYFVLPIEFKLSH